MASGGRLLRPRTCPPSKPGVRQRSPALASPARSRGSTSPAAISWLSHGPSTASSQHPDSRGLLRAPPAAPAWRSAAPNAAAPRVPSRQRHHLKLRRSIFTPPNRINCLTLLQFSRSNSTSKTPLFRPEARSG